MGKKTDKKHDRTSAEREISDVFYEQGVRLRAVPVKHSRPTSQIECANVDATIARIVYELNQRGLPTLFSCSGLVQDHDRYDEPSNGYIEFRAPEGG